MIAFRAVWLLISLTLAGCAAAPQPDALPQAWLKPGVRVALPAPLLNEKLDQQQLLTGTVDGKQQSMLVLLNADGQSLQLAGLSPLGIRLFKVVYNKQGIHTEQAIKIAQLPPANQVLADIMLSYWPINRWQPLLPACWQTPRASRLVESNTRCSRASASRCRLRSSRSTITSLSRMLEVVRDLFFRRWHGQRVGWRAGRNSR